MLDLFVKGGFAMYPLLAPSIVTVAITIERFVYLRKARIDTGLLGSLLTPFVGGRSAESLGVMIATG